MPRLASSMNMGAPLKPALVAAFFLTTNAKKSTNVPIVSEWHLAVDCLVRKPVMTLAGPKPLRFPISTSYSTTRTGKATGHVG